ncbi:MAG TPA: hypothetical protein ENN73_06710 [Firmicutes bacterium]|nr:hypothetical protein [Bacillota bacterium]
MGRFEWLEMPDNNKEIKKEKKSFIDMSKEEFMKRAKEDLFSGNFESSIRYFSRALGEDPTIEEAWFWQSWILVQLNELKEAKTWINKALEKFPESIDLISLKGLVMVLSGDFDLGRAYLDNALEKKGDHKYTWLYRGYLLLFERPILNFKHAQMCFSKAQEKGSKDWFFLCNLALAYIENNYPDYAFEIINKAKKLKGVSPYIYYVESRANLMSSNFNKALDLINKALILSPRFEIGRRLHEHIENERGILYEIKNLFKRVFRR